jgi:hypothetical protein
MTLKEWSSIYSVPYRSCGRYATMLDCDMSKFAKDNLSTAYHLEDYALLGFDEGSKEYTFRSR